MVRLKGVNGDRNTFVQCNFNSNMVRLKDDKVRIIQGQRLGFQFQYGSIKSNRYMLFVPIHLLFQFQYGSIKSRAFDN
jgi:hypothetical protein